MQIITKINKSCAYLLGKYMHRGVPNNPFPSSCFGMCFRPGVHSRGAYMRASARTFTTYPAYAVSGDDDGGPGRVGTWILAVLLVAPVALAVACFCWRYHSERVDRHKARILLDRHNARVLLARLDKPTPKRNGVSPASSVVTCEKKVARRAFKRHQQIDGGRDGVCWMTCALSELCLVSFVVDVENVFVSAGRPLVGK